MNLIVVLIFEPILILGVAFLLFVKKIRPYFVLTFVVVALLHLFYFVIIPVKDNNWFVSLLIRIGVDAIVILSLGFFLRKRRIQRQLSHGKEE